MRKTVNIPIELPEMTTELLKGAVEILNEDWPGENYFQGLVDLITQVSPWSEVAGGSDFFTEEEKWALIEKTLRDELEEAELRWNTTPLVEEDHRPRHDSKGVVWYFEKGYWRANPAGLRYEYLSEIDDVYGPLTFTWVK